MTYGNCAPVDDQKLMHALHKCQFRTQKNVIMEAKHIHNCEEGVHTKDHDTCDEARRWALTGNLHALRGTVEAIQFERYQN